MYTKWIHLLRSENCCCRLSPQKLAEHLQAVKLQSGLVAAASFIDFFKRGRKSGTSLKTRNCFIPVFLLGDECWLTSLPFSY
jgi:hypothetical protein